MSQIFEALRRSRESDRQERSARRNAQTDAVLATMGFASERPRSARQRYAPLVLLVLLGAIAWLGWRWYAEGDRVLLNQPQTSSSRQAPAPAAPPAQPPAPPMQAPQEITTASEAPPPVSQAESSTAPAASSSGPARPPRTRVADAQQSVAIDAFQRALSYHRAGDLDNALKHYSAVLREHDRNPQAHNNIGLLYRDKGMLQEAVRHFERALLADANYHAARNNLGVVLMALGRLDEAASQFRHVLGEHPGDIDARINLALVEKSTGRHGVAVETLLGALGTNPQNPAVHYNLGVLYEHAGEERRALEHYRSFLKYARPQHAERTPEVRARVGELSRRVARQ